MAKMTGLGSHFYVGSADLSGDTAALGRVASPIGVLPSTGIDKLANERMHAHKDGEIAWTSWFNDAAGQAHQTLKQIPSADIIASYVVGVPAIGSHAASQVSKQVTYAPTRGDDGSLQVGVQALANSFGLEWGRLLTAGKRTDTGAANGASLDYGAAVGTTAFGLQMYVHLFAFTGTSVTIKVQSSTDDGGGDAFADIAGATTAALSAVGAVRVATGPTASVERYLRVVTTGTFSNAQFAVNVVRNTEAPVF